MKSHNPPFNFIATPQEELKRKIEERKRLLYLIASLISLPSVLLAWYFYGATNPFSSRLYLLLLIDIVLWTLALLWRRVPLRWLECWVLLTISLFFLVKYVHHLFYDNPNIVWREIEIISSGTIILFIIAYMILPSQLAFRLSLIYTGVTLVLGLWRFIPDEHGFLPDLIRWETRLIVIAILLFTLAKVKDDLLIAQKQADYWERQANIDHLTQLPNRRMISALIEQALLNRLPLVILLIDLDDFKCFNDTYGHDVGDILIARVGSILRTNLRANDFVARWGGEEFLVLLTETTAEQALQLAERLRNEVEKIEFEEDHLSISIGGTLSHPGDSLTTVLKRADAALYAAKAQGRNCVCWA
ncbi:MAG: GGDEF domain-containing protein [Anaerolineales bacterium]|nr:GGDEF domain-containing protein [Anaerolineales bacterium]MDW8161469.1 GGDEF domain-containing protein [Anaerolineales bacterium]